MSGYQTYHVPESSRFAILTAVSVAVTIVGAGGMFNYMTYEQGNSAIASYMFYLGLLGFLCCLFFWFKQAVTENLQGLNSAQLKRSYVIGMGWFIGSEVFFFATFFGALFYVRALAGPWLQSDSEKLLWEGFVYNWPMMTTPQDAIGIQNQVQANVGVYTGPEQNMAPPSPGGWLGLFSGAFWGNLVTWVPFWNTVCLLSSSVTVHFAHVGLKHNNRSKFNFWLGVTLALAFAFICLQAYEYYEAYNHLGLKLDSGIYGSTFFMLTGFHGFHVCMGAIMLATQFVRSVWKGHFTHDNSFGFEASSWYWHFVDVVWIGLVLFVYVI